MKYDKQNTFAPGCNSTNTRLINNDLITSIILQTIYMPLHNKCSNLEKQRWCTRLIQQRHQVNWTEINDRNKTANDGLRSLMAIQQQQMQIEHGAVYAMAFLIDAILRTTCISNYNSQNSQCPWCFRNHLQNFFSRIMH